eukprot:scaffold280769_cov22-Tisochrysis_lutea.AAC.1
MQSHLCHTCESLTTHAQRQHVHAADAGEPSCSAHTSSKPICVDCIAIVFANWLCRSPSDRVQQDFQRGWGRARVLMQFVQEALYSAMFFAARFHLRMP